jgi:hypothetical protein
MQCSISIPKKRMDLASNLLHLCKREDLSVQSVFDVLMNDKSNEIYNYSSINPIMENGEEISCPKGRRGRAGEPGFPANESRQGYLYESLCELLILCKCFRGLDYKEVREGQIQNHKKVENCRSLLNNNIHNGNNVADMILVQEEATVLISMKYRGKFNPKDSDISHLDNTSSKLAGEQTVKMSLIVKDAKQVRDHKYTNSQNIHKQLHDKVIQDNLLFDTTDVIAAVAAFKESDLLKSSQTVEDLVEMINADYLLSPRKQLVLKLHQKMAFLKFVEALTVSSTLQYCFAHKQRSGKSILLMTICKHLLESVTVSIKKILVMTSVPATLDSFKSDLDSWIPFKNINYCKQENISSLNADFKGIAFCSVQYLKMDAERKQQYLKNVGFDAIIVDESHLGSSTEKTKTGILAVDADAYTVASIEEIQKKTRISIFASGTSDKTRSYYRIPAKHVHEWDMVDEAMMKQLQKETEANQEIRGFMEKKHGPFFSQCLADPTLNKDYSTMPVQVLMKHSISQDIVKRIIRYNLDHGTKYGYSCSSFFALNQVQDAISKKTKYQSAFELANTSDGEDLLIAFFKSIIDCDPMNKATIMKQLEETQTARGSRKSTRESPKLFLVYLPTHTRNNNIVQLQETLVAFLGAHGLWLDYQLEFSNSGDDSGDVKECYNAFIQTIMQRTKDNQKKGCILFLGNKGGVGITYKDCDVTISLDDGHNLDNQKQRNSRALTDAPGKTIGINVDMNIQRTYLLLADMLHRYKRNTKTKQSNAEILHYLYTQNVFLFDPQAVNQGKMKTVDMHAHFLKEAELMIQSVTDYTKILDDICCDGDKLRDFILDGWEKRVVSKKNAFYEEMEGDQQDCPKGDKTKHEVEPEPATDKGDANDIESNLSLEEKQLANQTEEMCKTFMFPLLALISRAYGIHCFKEIFTDAVTGPLIVTLLKDKINSKKNETITSKTDIKESNFFIVQEVMSDIIDYNVDVVNDIREIYSSASPDQLRALIAKHFVPTEEEKKENAEVSTPVSLVDDMLSNDVIPAEFWQKQICRIYEPCCGKGNFVLAIFDKFEEALRERFPDNEERCRHIINNCLYYGDITSLNVFITTELLKCQVQSYCGLDEVDDSFKFNSHIGDALTFDAKRHWKILGFHGVVGNPPYNSSGDVSTGNTIWQDFTRKALSHWVMPDGYLLFVHPSGWRKPNSQRGRFNGMLDLMCKKNHMITLEIHGLEDGKKTFNCGTRYDWYLVQASQPSQDALTKVRDEKGVTTLIDMTKFNWFPNSNVEEISKLIATSPEDSLASLMVYSPSAYEHRKSWMSHKKDEAAGFIHPCVHSTPAAGVRYMYSKVNNNGHFGVKKVIFGEGGIDNAVFDKDGKYGCTNGTFGIIVDNDADGEALLALKDNEKFKKMLKDSMCWSSFRVDWNMFKHFKKGFWVYF